MSTEEQDYKSGITAMDKRISLLESERNRLKADLEEYRELHAECHLNVDIWKEDRDLWKFRAEKLVQALKGIHNWDAKNSDSLRRLAKAALSDFEAEKP